MMPARPGRTGIAMDGDQEEIAAVRELLSSKPRPVGWAERRERLDEVNGRRGFWRSGVKECRQYLCLVAGLHFYHIVEVGRIEQLRAIEAQDEFRL